MLECWGCVFMVAEHWVIDPVLCPAYAMDAAVLQQLLQAATEAANAVARASTSTGNVSQIGKLVKQPTVFGSSSV